MEIALLLIGALLGAIASWAITHIYYMKGKGLEKLTQNLWLSMSNVLIRQMYPDMFSPLARYQTGLLGNSEDAGTPYIKEVRSILENNDVRGLIRVIDVDWDHPTGNVILIIEGENAGIKYIGFGYSEFCKTVASRGDKPITLGFCLTDRKNNQKIQTFTVQR
jgi:hypothetical protein